MLQKKIYIRGSDLFSPTILCVCPGTKNHIIYATHIFLHIFYVGRKKTLYIYTAPLSLFQSDKHTSHIWTHTRTHRQILTNTHTHTRSHTHTRTHTDTHTHTHALTHTHQFCVFHFLCSRRRIDLNYRHSPKLSK